MLTYRINSLFLNFYYNPNIYKFQWTYVTGNRWGICSNGMKGLACGPQETFRACSDVGIISRGRSVKYHSRYFQLNLKISLNENIWLPFFSFFCVVSLKGIFLLIQAYRLCQLQRWRHQSFPGLRWCLPLPPNYNLFWQFLRQLSLPVWNMSLFLINEILAE